MSGSKVTAATLVNKIVYRTDLNSLKKVRNDMKKLQQEFSKSHNQVAKAKQAADKQVYQAQIKQQRDIDKQQKQAAKQAAVDAKSKANEQKKLAAAQARALKVQQQQSKKIATQQENADLARKRAAFQLGRLQGMDGASRYQAIKQANAIVDAYARGNQSLKSMNQALSQHIAQQKALARNQRRQAKQSGKKSKAGRSGSSGWLSQNVNAIVPQQLLSGAAGVYLGQQMYAISSQAISDSLARNQDRKMVSSMGLNPLEADAAIMETLKRTGFVMSGAKISDIAKDVQDKIGQLSLGEWKQNKKTGDWNFSGGGEMSDWLQIMVNRGGYSQQGALKTLQDVKGPVELAVLLKSLQKSAKLTESEFTALAETINDFSYLAKSVDASGQNVIDTMNMMVENGLALNDAQQKTIDGLNQMGIVWGAIKDSGADHFTLGFAEAMKQANLNSDNLAKSFSGLNPLMENLGQSAGELSRVFLDFANKIGLNVGKGQTLPDAVYNTVVDSSANSAADWIQNMIGFDPRSVGRFFGSDSSYANQVQSGTLMNQMMPTTPSMQYQPVIPDLKADFNLTVNPSPEFGMMVEAVADKRIEWAFDDQNFQINQSILGE
ncbi:lytic transglycosylase, catalytic [Klebsiella quasipneumoniae]|uniref:cell envelope integrity protein TolA n=1 Tax=Klebsiella quasipneumoniae TaxID=1463165 RepID=UPI0009BC4ECE|nr:cell envelope integrity protein TolA [Klebsiella quasipneumoniae]SLV89767.1 lytic transglycosylase, catalytic [Klebsiella quasipneumoniae]SLW23341.1 lytic transglycosylase, catalytic [Klebsiella quasipneumoniae]SMA20546.1 lytic transglycosylase, catalytic [Klebsiella quasipneumoniae]SMA27377.1 lytic transglycosylase, catalytic [Klebsiella quasipneumoniae]SMA28974.1 lytic transglycosylase, catalytic [Klebsiella quasipneumoniae]